MTVQPLAPDPTADVLSIGKKGRIQLTIVVALVVAIYHHTFAVLWGVWMNNENYSHGVLIPVVAAFLVYSQRERLKRLPRSPSRLGLPVIGAALLVQLAGLRGDVLILQGDSLILLLAGFVLHFFGWRWLGLLWFPIAYLLFMIPFLPIFQSLVSFRLKQLAATAATVVSGWLGIMVQRDGMSLFLTTGALRIENACSGMQSLVSLMALGALFAYMAGGNPLQRVTLFLFSIPIALLVNIIRINSLCIVGTATSVETATGFFHDASGYVLFGLGFVLLMGAKRLLRC